MEDQMSETMGAQEAQPRNILARIVGVILSPKEAMQDIARHPTWLIPLLLLVLTGVLSGYFLQDLIWQQAMEQIQNNPKLSPDQIQQSLATAEKITKIGAIAGPLIFVPLLYLLFAGVLLFTGNILLGGEARFKTIFSVVCWSGMVSIVGSLITIPIMLSRGAMVSATSLTFLAPEAEMQSVTYFLLSQFDLFYLWWLAVMGVGLAAAYKFTIQKGIVIVFSWWVVYLLIASAIKMAFS